MVVIGDTAQRTIAQLLVTVYRKSQLLPPYLYTHAHVHGEGEYLHHSDKEALFGMMLHAITKQLDRRLCLYIEFSGIEKKMFAYRQFREAGYFPVGWQEVYNSLHSKNPKQRLSAKMIERIDKLTLKGVETHEVNTQQDIHDFYSLLKKYYRLKPRKHIPACQYFEGMAASKAAKIFVTTYKGKIIGGCTCVYHQGNVYLWHLAAKRKTYATLHPDLMTVWNIIQRSYQQQYRHIHFMDVGLPWTKNSFRDFILSFGGKPVAKFRWFRFYSHFINVILKWLYKSK